MRPVPHSQRPRIPFRSVNRRDRPGYDSQMQRHHLLPRQLLTRPSLRILLESMDRRRVGFDDFRINGMLLPAGEESAVMTSLPLHRGPHRHYNDMVMERVGQIERDWSARRGLSGTSACDDAMMRLALLQAALRRRLLDTMGRRLLLNRRDPRGGAVDFSDLDAMADALWGATDFPGDPFSESLIVEAAPAPVQPASAFAALSTARTLAVATSGWMPTPQTTEPSSRVHST
jgi:hypothetical protein